MKEIIKEMVINAEIHHDFELAESVYKLISKLAETFNAPSNWQDIGEELAEEFSCNNWIMDNCKLYEFE